MGHLSVSNRVVTPLRRSSAHNFPVDRQRGVSGTCSLDSRTSCGGGSGPARTMYERSRRFAPERVQKDRTYWAATLALAFMQFSGGCGIRTHEDASTP